MSLTSEFLDFDATVVIALHYPHFLWVAGRLWEKYVKHQNLSIPVSDIRLEYQRVCKTILLSSTCTTFYSSTKYGCVMKQCMSSLKYNLECHEKYNPLYRTLHVHTIQWLWRLMNRASVIVLLTAAQNSQPFSGQPHPSVSHKPWVSAGVWMLTGSSCS